MAKIISGGTIVSPKKSYLSDLRIEGGKIVAIGENIYVEGDEIVDVNGCYILPGAIDVHTHFALDIGSTITSDDFASGTKAALAGGTTTIIDFINHKRGTSFTSCYNYYKTLTNNKCYCDFGFHMTISEWNNSLENEMEKIIDRGITTFKMYMAYKDILQVEDDVIEKALTKAKSFGVLLSFHCESGDDIYNNVKALIATGKTEPIYHEISRDDEVELKAVKRLIDISDKVDYPVYIVHLSSKKALEEVRVRREKGSKVILETCPQYLLLDKSLYKGTEEDSFNGAKYVMSPPLRQKSDNEALWEAIRENEIQVLATDHCSFNYKGQKELGINDFYKIPNGAPGVEHRLILLYSYGVEENKISINKFVEITAENPAKIFGLYPRKGVLEVGSDGDILVIKGDHKGIITFEDQYQNVDYTPYEGFKNNLYLKAIYLRGTEVVRDNKVIIENSIGEYISRDKFNMEEYL